MGSEEGGVPPSSDKPAALRLRSPLPAPPVQAGQEGGSPLTDFRTAKALRCFTIPGVLNFRDGSCQIGGPNHGLQPTARARSPLEWL
jgi:hypothetical protein